MTKDDASWLNILYVCFAVTVGFVAFKAVETAGIQLGWSERYDAWWHYVANPTAVAIGALSGYLLRRKPDRHEYLLSAIGEVRKVSWPSLEDTRKMTIIVCIVVAIFGVLLAVMDLVFGKAVGMLLT